MVPCHVGEFSQVVLNLLVNSAHSIAQVVGNGSGAKGKITIRTKQDREWTEISIQDTGAGIPEEIRSRIFEPFFTTKGVGKGTGLGLSTVYGIIQQNHGTIHVNSHPSRGTTFEILLPAVPGGEHTRPTPPEPLESLRGSETILVAEDEPGLRKLVQETLEQFGYKVLQAGDGDEALRVLEQHGPVHLLLTDVIMPLMGGRQLAERVISLQPATKVVYMSGYTDDTLAFYGLPWADADYIQKPFTPLALAEKLRQSLSTGQKT